MRPKIADLSIKLNAAGEYETADKATAAGRRLNTFFDEVLAGGAGKPSNNAGIFDDFNSLGGQRQAGFDQFNAFGNSQQAPPQPPKQSAADFWSQNGHEAPVNPQAPKVTATRSFFDEVQADPFPRTSPNSFFDTPHLTDTPKLPVQTASKPVHDDINLLGLDEPVAQPKQQASAPQQLPASTSLGPSFDLLGMSVGKDQQQVPTNPFVTPTAPVLPTGAAGLLGLQQQQLLKMMQMNPLLQQQLLMNPVLYQQMLLNPGASLGMGAQVNAGLGGQLGQQQQSPAFGAQNKVSFQEPSRAPVQEKRQYDPFNDLAADLI